MIFHHHPGDERTRRMPAGKSKGTITLVTPGIAGMAQPFLVKGK